NEMEAVVFPDLYREVHRFLEEEMIIKVTGKIESRNNTVQWLLSVIKPFKEEMLLSKSKNNKKRLFIRFSKDEHYAGIQLIQSIAAKYPGKIPIIVYHEDVKETYQLHQSFDVSADEDCLSVLQARFGETNVVLSK